MTQSQTHSISSGPASAPAPVRHYSKAIVAMLAAVLGVFGAHWWYLGRPKAWAVTAVACLLLVLAQFYPSWWDNFPFLLLTIPATAGFIEALIFSLKPDEQFDAKYNPKSHRVTRTGWGPVLIAIFTTLIGGAILVMGITAMVMHVYISMGWLDGFVF